jgi:hypothetical protein
MGHLARLGHSRKPTDFAARLEGFPFEPGMVFVPDDLKLEGKRLLWRIGPRFKRPRGSILQRFRTLHASEDDASVLQFARDFGVACFCKHKLPGSHAQVFAGQQFGMEDCCPKAREDGYEEEDVEDYRSFSLAADCILEAARSANTGQIPDDRLFSGFRLTRRPKVIGGKPRRTPTRRAKLDAARQRIAYEVNAWISISAVRPQLQWVPAERAWKHTLAQSELGVLGAVALALLSTVPPVGGTQVICAACSRVYAPARATAPGRNNFCEKCRGTPKMWAVLKRQQRSREE